MKRIHLMLVSILMGTGLAAQGLGNIFSQGAADLKCMAKQMVLIQLYISWIEKGYQIAGSGLQVIRDIKQGEWNLHSMFYGSLAQVNPAIKQCADVTGAIRFQAAVIRELGEINQIKQLSPEEMEYLLEIGDNLLNDCSRDLDHLINLISDDIFRMSDDERILSLHEIDLNMENHYKTACELVAGAQSVAAQKQWEEQDIQRLKNLER